MPTLTMPKLALHPLCEIIPPCTDKEFEELKKDIEDNGLQVPIKTFEAKILDGRSRYKACIELGKEPKTEIFAGTSNDALAYVISMNVKRRHLSASQRALIVARLVTSKLGGDRSVKLPTEITQDDVAKLAGVAVKTVTDAKKVLGRPDIADRVLKGELAVAKAAKQVREEENSQNNNDQMDDEIVDLSARIIREDEEPTLPEGCTARQFMQMVMRGEIDPLPKQINAAKVLIEYEGAQTICCCRWSYGWHGFRERSRAGDRAQPIIIRAKGATSTRAASRQRTEGQLSGAKAQPSLASTLIYLKLLRLEFL
jgi:ParB-like chromosome segregation protein Spo0J